MSDELQKGANFYKTSKFDIFLIALILFFSIASVLRVTYSRIKQSAQARTALIYEKDKLIEEVPLKGERIITLAAGQMQIEVKGGKIRVRKADCPQHICMNMGWIEYAGQSIVCVPNKVVIEIKSAGPPLLDAVVY